MSEDIIKSDEIFIDRLNEAEANLLLKHHDLKSEPFFTSLVDEANKLTEDAKRMNEQLKSYQGGKTPWYYRCNKALRHTQENRKKLVRTIQALCHLAKNLTSIKRAEVSLEESSLRKELGRLKSTVYQLQGKLHSQKVQIEKTSKVTEKRASFAERKLVEVKRLLLEHGIDRETLFPIFDTAEIKAKQWLEARASPCQRYPDEEPSPLSEHTQTSPQGLYIHDP